MARILAIPSAVDPPLWERARPRRRHDTTGVRDGNHAGGAGGGSARLARVDGGMTGSAILPSRSQSAPAGGFRSCPLTGAGAARAARACPAPPQRQAEAGTGGACATRAGPAGATVRAASAARLD